METKFIGEKVRHNQLKTILVNHVLEGSRTKLVVTVIDRGPGYDAFHKKYKGVKTKNGWYRGENREFGNQDIIHINSIQKPHAAAI